MRSPVRSWFYLVTSLQSLIIKTYKDPSKFNTDCEGDVHFFRVDKRMVSTSWVLQCDLCEFNSDITIMTQAGRVRIGQC